MNYLATTSLLVTALLGCGGTVQTTGGGGSSGTTGRGGAGGTTSSSQATSGTTTTTSSSVATSSSSGGTCDAASCQFMCCGATCANPANDIDNCGTCGNKCTGANPYCDNGKCGVPPCAGQNCGIAGTCCGSSCCTAGQLCCTVSGPVEATTCFTPSATGTCPTGCKGCVCTSPDTPIATPTGDRPIASLKEGDLVYSVDHGRVVAVPLRAIISVPAPDHVVVQVTLAGGHVLEISPRHPTADGRTFADLRTGATLDGVSILDARAIPYAHERTHDILPDSDTGTYFAGGVLIGSTLSPGAARVDEPTAPLSTR